MEMKICPFFKFSALEHFCGPKLISWVDIWDNLFDSGGFSMDRTKPLVPGIDYIASGYNGGSEHTDMLSSRNGRTYSITFQYNFGDMKDNQNIHHRNSYDSEALVNKVIADDAGQP